MANKQRHAITNPEAGQTHRVPVTIADRTIPLPVDCRLALSWIGKSRAREKVLWQLNTDGSATGLHEAKYLERLLDAEKNDPDLSAAIRTQFASGQFHPEDRLILPDPVIAHITGALAPDVDQLIWLFTKNDRIELMNASKFQNELEDAHEAIAQLLDL